MYKLFVYVIFFVFLLPIYANAAECYEIVKQKSDATPSHIDLYTQICINAVYSENVDGEEKIFIEGSYKLRQSLKWPEVLERRFSRTYTVPNGYNGKGWLRIKTFNADNSRSLRHYWRSRAYLNIKRTHAKFIFLVRGDVYEKRYNPGLTRYDISYNRIN